MAEPSSEKRDEPEDPTGILNQPVLSPLDAMTIQLNEVYESLKRAGFNPPEAITMVTGLLTNMIQYSPMMSDGDDDDDNEDEYDNDNEDDDDWNYREDDD